MVAMTAAAGVAEVEATMAEVVVRAVQAPTSPTLRVEAGADPVQRALGATTLTVNAGSLGGTGGGNSGLGGNGSKNGTAGADGYVSLTLEVV